MVTRERSQAREMIRLFSRAGARVLLAPLVGFHAGSRAPLAASARRVSAGRYAWVFFTSANGVRFWNGAWRGAPNRSGQPPAKIAAVGRSTEKALRRLGWKAHCVPGVSSARALLRKWDRRSRAAPGQRVLLVQPESSLPGLARGLRLAGARPERVIAYRTVRPRKIPGRLLPALRAKGVCRVALASPSAARNLAWFLKRTRPPIPLRAVRTACIGPTTAAQARRLGFRVEAVAKRPSAQGLVQAVIAAVKKERDRLKDGPWPLVGR